MKRFLGFLLRPLSLAVIGFLLLAALIWWVGPLLPYGGAHPLDGVGERLSMLGLLLLIFGAVFGVRAWRRRRTNRRLVAGLAAGPSGAEREAKALQERFSQALKVLGDSARQHGKASWLKRGQFLYELPWYMFIGLPGSGKTTALLNAGLTFPLAGKMGQASVRGVGGTRNCEWWFTDEAVLIDTAGRYTSQDSDTATDAAAWQTFLALLRKSRPRQPLNGVMLTVNIEDLLRQGPAERKEHAHKLRTRLQELQSNLGVRPPVYVLITKCDLIAGFNETFGEFGREDREQVWGFTFPFDANDPNASNPNNATPLQDFSSEFAALSKRLRDGLVERMQAEPDVMRRAVVFAFPQQFEGVKGLLGGFLEQVFEGGGELEERAFVRGVYFTSGTQEGSPIDRVLGTLGRTFGVDQRAGAVPAWRGKAFFLTRLLKEVVFAEQGLVGRNHRAETLRRRWRLGAISGMGLASLALGAGWAISYGRNLNYLADVQAKLPEVQAAVSAVPPATGAALSVLPSALDQLTALPTPATFALDEPPLLNTLGLYQGPYVAGGTDIGYRKLLDNALMPRVTRRLEERLRAANRDNLELAYESLKGYMMLYTPEHFDADGFKAWVALDWDANLTTTLTAEQRAALVQHLDAAVSRGAPPALTAMDKTLVANVREMLVAFPLEYRIVSRMKRARLGADFPEFTAAGAGGPNAIRVFERNSGQALTKGIPGLFTRDGYFKAFKPSIAKAIPALAEEERWVLGVTKPVETIKAKAGGLAGGLLQGPNAELQARVERLYLQEYIKVWDQYLADVRLVKLGGLERSLTVAGLLAAPDSPLASYLRAVARETQPGAAVMAANAAATTSGQALRNNTLNKLDRAKDDLTNLLGKVAGAEPNKAPGRPLEMMVDDHFAPLHRMVTGTPPPIDETMKMFNDVFVQLTAIDTAQKTKTAPPAGGGGAAAKAAAGLQPEPIKSMLLALADTGATQGRVAERQGLSTDIKPMADQCNKTIAGRYPFALGSNADVLPDDFGQMFGVGGQLDEFFKSKLADKTDTGVTPWVYKPDASGTRPPGGGALGDFQRAAKIREAFFRSGGKAPGFKVDLRLLELDANTKELQLDVDGQVLKFAAGNSAAQTITWPSTRVASQIKLSLDTANQLHSGPWALFRLIGQHEVQASPQPERFTVVINLEGRKAKLEVIAASALNPLRLREMQAFRCPAGL
jgi:type VI secretion system protein ImpL